MAAMTTVLKKFSELGNTRNYVTSSHTVAKPQVVLQKRKVPSNSSAVAEDILTVLFGTEDSAGDPLSARVAFTVTARRPNDGIPADRAAALALFREVVASDEFQEVIDGQFWLQS